jgi:hypothetical protein
MFWFCTVLLLTNNVVGKQDTKILAKASKEQGEQQQQG